MKNKIGFNLLAWSAGVSPVVFPLMERLKTIGYDGVEILIASQNNQEYKDLAQHASQLSLEVNTVLVMGEQENPISPDTAIRSAGLERINWAIDRAYDVGATVLCGPFHSAHGVFAAHAPTEEEFKWAAEVLNQAGEYAKQAGVVLALEAVNRFETYLCNTMEKLAHLIELSDHPHVRAMYDTHHANIEEKRIKEPIERISPYLAHVHISENDRGTPGIGLVHWEEVFSSLRDVNYEGWYTIEAFSRDDPDFANAINVWREYSDPWEIAEHGYAFIRSQLTK
ncbi:sugar phosphate isomerase/epimerase [Sphingobacterium shayense]|uniref:sugar phosphate isomerase/epimerase family protein n=1 Tax=Sphingobacterium shayense TaxID=626343 RepID=UPI00155596CB|nr:sugar phosphate isomerase/epimerase family protein [Sphingobacterium shayense]NQD69379.1 sugar phosphate isomerase/epimerase [Sphingobacterium shayense]